MSLETDQRTPKIDEADPRHVETWRCFDVKLQMAQSLWLEGSPPFSTILHPSASARSALDLVHWPRSFTKEVRTKTYQTIPNQPNHTKPYQTNQTCAFPCLLWVRLHAADKVRIRLVQLLNLVSASPTGHRHCFNPGCFKFIPFPYKEKWLTNKCKRCESRAVTIHVVGLLFV